MSLHLKCRQSRASAARILPDGKKTRMLPIVLALRGPTDPVKAVPLAQVQREPPCSKVHSLPTRLAPRPVKSHPKGVQEHKSGHSLILAFCRICLLHLTRRQHPHQKWMSKIFSLSIVDPLSLSCLTMLRTLSSSQPTSSLLLPLELKIKAHIWTPFIP